MFLLEPFLFEVLAQFHCLNDSAERTTLGLKVSAFQTDHSIGNSITLIVRDVLPNYLHQVGEGHHSSAYYEIIVSLLFFTAKVLRVTVVKSYGLTHFLCHTYLFACSVNQLELALRKQNGERNTWETTACAEIENLGTWLETNELADGHGVEYVMLVEVVNVFARNDVDFLVPFVVKSIKGSQLF